MYFNRVRLSVYAREVVAVQQFAILWWIFFFGQKPSTQMFPSAVAPILLFTSILLLIRSKSQSKKWPYVLLIGLSAVSWFSTEPAFTLQLIITGFLVCLFVLEFIKLKSTKLYGEVTFLAMSVVASVAAMANQLERIYYIQAGKGTQFIISCVAAMRVLLAIATICFMIGLAKTKFTKIYNWIKTRYDSVMRHFSQNHSPNNSDNPETGSESELEPEEEEEQEAPQAAPAPAPAVPTTAPTNKYARARTAALKAYSETRRTTDHTSALVAGMEAFVDALPETTDEQYEGMMSWLEGVGRQQQPTPQQSPRPQGDSGSRQQRRGGQHHRPQRQNPQSNGGGSQQSD